MPKARVHNEWFMAISKKTCPCGCKKTQVYAWGEYVRAKWRTVEHFCKECFVKRVLNRLITHKNQCGCEFALISRVGHSLPDWLKMPNQSCSVA